MKIRLLIALVSAVWLWSCTIQYYDIPIKNGKLAGILPIAGGRVQYQFAEPINNVPAKTIFSRIRRYAALHVESPTGIIAQSDPSALEIICPAQLMGGLFKARGIDYAVGSTDITLVIMVKDGGYQIIAGNFRVDEGFVPGKLANTPRKHIETATTVYPELYKLHFADIDKQMKNLNESIRDAALTE